MYTPTRQTPLMCCTLSVDAKGAEMTTRQNINEAKERLATALVDGDSRKAAAARNEIRALVRKTNW